MDSQLTIIKAYREKNDFIPTPAFPLLALFILAGCSTRPNTTLNINPEMTLPNRILA